MQKTAARETRILIRLLNHRVGYFKDSLTWAAVKKITGLTVLFVKDYFKRINSFSSERYMLS